MFPGLNQDKGCAVFQMMPGRYEMFKLAFQGYEKTGAPLVAYIGDKLSAVGFGDDIGAYYFITLIHHYLRLSADASIFYFYLGLVIISFLVGLIGFCLLFKRRLSKIIAFIGLVVLSHLSWNIGDVYIVPSCLAVAVIPWALYFIRKQKYTISFMLFFLACGLLIGSASAIRIQAGTAVLLFIIYLIVFALNLEWKAKLKLLGALLIGVLIVHGYFFLLLRERDNYLAKNQPNYVKPSKSHVFWHSAYIGFGFLTNEEGIKYLDKVAINKVRSIDPNAPFLSERYEQILRAETLNLCRNIIFFRDTIFAKIGVLLYFVLIYFNLGLIAWWKSRHRWQEEGAFVAGLLFSALPGILAIPRYNYLLGFIAFNVLYGIYCLDNVLSQKSLEKSELCHRLPKIVEQE